MTMTLEPRNKISHDAGNVSDIHVSDAVVKRNANRMLTHSSNHEELDALAKLRAIAT